MNNTNADFVWPRFTASLRCGEYLPNSAYFGTVTEHNCSAARLACEASADEVPDGVIDWTHKWVPTAACAE